MEFGELFLGFLAGPLGSVEVGVIGWPVFFEQVHFLASAASLIPAKLLQEIGLHVK